VKSVRLVTIDDALCKACGICIELCPKQVYDADKLGTPVVARPSDCTACMFCEWHCPEFAIRVAVAAEPRQFVAASANPEED
jgi:2-oxoglutarate ferredoxin oxidoreductase subunit delta